MTEYRNNTKQFDSGNGTGLPRSFTPENRRKDGALFRKIRERIREGYYESAQVLRTIADKISNT